MIKVGAPLPLTGPLSPEGLKQKRGYDLWAEAANAKGGIKAGGKTYKVEIVYADYASNTPRAVQSAERMITEDKVNFLFAPFGSGATKAASAVSEKYGIPMLAPTASSAEVYDQNYKFLFGTLTPNDTVSEPIAKLVTEKNQQHQARRHPGTQRPVPAGGRAGVRKGRQGAEPRSRNVRALRHRHDGSFRRDHADARRASRLGLCVRLHQRSHPHPQADERPWPQAAGHHHDRGPGLSGIRQDRRSARGEHHEHVVVASGGALQGQGRVRLDRGVQCGLGEEIRRRGRLRRGVVRCGRRDPAAGHRGRQFDRSEEGARRDRGARRRNLLRQGQVRRGGTDQLARAAGVSASGRQAGRALARRHQAGRVQVLMRPDFGRAAATHRRAGLSERHGFGAQAPRS